MSTTRRGKLGPAGEVARPRCAILARVSTDAQHLDAQVPMLHAEAQRRGFDVIAVIEDVGSGRKMDEREGLRRALELADARAIDVLLVAELSRVGRSVAGLSRVVERLTARRVSLVSVRESIDLSSPAGRMFVHVLAAVAEFEVECLRERTSAGVTAAAARGRAVGKAPFGTRWRLQPCDVDPITGDKLQRPAVLEPVPDELATLRRARELRNLGLRWEDVAATLNAEGHRNRATRKRSGLPWRRNLLARAVENPRVEPYLATPPSTTAASAAA